MHSAGKNDTAIRGALQQAARALPGRFGAERLFLEARVDLRIETGWDRSHDRRVSESSGVAIDGRDSFHVTGGDVEALVPLIEGSKDARRDWSDEPPVRGEPLWIDQASVEDWVREKSIVAETVSPSIEDIEANPLGRWTLTLVAFRQVVWVVHADGRIAQDLREGSRVELQTWFAGHPNTKAIVDRVYGTQMQIRELLDFGPALERSTRRLAGCSAARVGTTAVVFAPGVGGVVIHELVGHALEGDTRLDRPTWLHGVRAPQGRAVRVFDDPRRGRGGWRTDDEGMPSGATLLVDGGLPVDLMLDRTSAAMRRRESNGHGRRASYLAPVRPRMGCTWIEPSGDAPGDVVRDTRLGVYIRRMSAGHTDPISGRASFIVSDADRIEDGAITDPLQPFVLELDGSSAWASIDRLADDLTFDTCVGSCVRDGQPLAVSVGAPTMRIGVASIVC